MMRVTAVDIEANGLLPEVDTVWCAVGVDLETEEITKFTPDNLSDLPAYLNSYDKIVGHNFVGYDAVVLNKVLGWEPKDKATIIDTWLLSMMSKPDRRKHIKTSPKKGAHSLENWGNVLGIPKPDHEEWDKYSEEMLVRCTDDARITAGAFRILKRETGWDKENSPFELAHRIESEFVKIVSEMSQTGFLVDKKLMLSHIEGLDQRMDEIDKEVIPQLPKIIIIEEMKKDGEYKWNSKPFKGDGTLSKYTSDWVDRVGLQDSSVIGGPFSRVRFEDFNLGSLDKVKEYLLGEGWIPEKWNTKKDPITGKEHRTSPKISQDEQFLGVNGKIGKAIATRLIYRHRKSALEGMVKLIRNDGRISAGVTGITPTVRLKHAGIVNIPGEDAVFGKEMREIFIAKPGYKIVGCDAASCQVRLLCHHMGDPEYTEAVLNGKKEDGTDVHSITMQATGIKVRREAKGFIYGFLFGAGNPKLGAIMGKGSKEGKKAKADFLARLPKLAQLIQRLNTQFKAKRCITGLDGRPILPRSGHMTLCYQLQSDEAILMKVATLYAYKKIKKEGLDAKLVVHMHDEYQWEVREDHAERVAEIASQSITAAGDWLGLTVPMDGDAAIGNSWWETH